MGRFNVKIEKGKLYYNHQLESVVISVEDSEDKSGILSDKIVVHCPTKVDWDYIVSKGYKLYHYDGCYINEPYFLINGLGYVYHTNRNIKEFHLITIDQFKEFYPHELAVKLKNLGFDKDCLTCYCKHWKDLEIYLWKINQPDYGNYWDLNSKVEAPLWQQAFDWFREKYNLHSWVYQSNSNSFHFTILKDGRYVRNGVNATHYQEARQACLEKLIQLVEDENTRI